MIFERLPPQLAEGLILAHATAGLKKGHRLTADDVAHLQSQAVAAITVARLGADDVAEDVAAEALAQAVAGPGCERRAAFTGRANLYAAEAGLAVVDEARVHALNRIDESLTLATLRNFERVEARQLLATLKIIPFAAPRAAVQAAQALLAAGPLLRVQPFRPRRIGLVLTTLPQQKPALVEKAKQVMQARIERLGSTLLPVESCAHVAEDVAESLVRLQMAKPDFLLVMGAAAIVDRADVIPAGLVLAGGAVQRLGMPVDPGNLLLLGRLGAVPVVGVPSCARSPKENGFDWVLNRLCAGLEVLPEDVAGMGVGGLLAEISSRPQPRGGAVAVMRPRMAAVVLAAGLSSRMGANKLLADFGGRALIAATVAQIKAAGIDDVVVVTGHEAQAVESALDGAGVTFVHNADFAAGLSTSVATGIKAVAGFDAAFICLGDMPLVQPQDLRRMMAAFDSAEGRSLVAPILGRKLGNPVLWGADYFPALQALSGDRGARSLLEARRDEITEIAVAHDGILRDADTPEALAEIRALANSAG